MSTTIRVSSATRDRLNMLARKQNRPAGELIGDLVARADDEALLAEAESGWQRLAMADDRLARYRAESDALTEFDAALPDY